MRGLVVGRFQPLHNGHRALVKRALEVCVDLAVGIGSAEARPSLRNPFTLDERRAMLAAVFPHELAAGQLRVLALPDLHDPPRWARHTLELVGPLDRVFGNDDETLSLFEQLNIVVERPGLVERERFEARAIRALLAEDDPTWRKAVPPAVADLLQRLDAGRRLRSLEAVA